MAVYACNASRCLAPIKSDDGQTLFMVGTQLLREANQVYLLEYEADSDSVQCISTYEHQHEVWDLAPCPHNQSKLFTCYNTGTDMKATLWEAPGGEGGSLQELLTLDSLTSAARRVLWSSDESSDTVLVTEEDSLSTWSLSAGAAQLAARSKQESTLHAKLWSATRSPHSQSDAAALAANQLSLWDLRTMKQTLTVEQAHSMPVRDVEYNPRNANILATVGDDAMLRFWDIRKLDECMMEVPAHSHAIWSVKFSPFHDRLVLTASSDTTAALWTALSQSVDSNSTENIPPSGAQTLGGWGPDKEAVDGLACRVQGHDDSVFGVAWSASDPWCFASLSNDGRVVVSAVPKSEKYKILL
mmetsp:Transcript_13061/g.15752  ORF Transcript_13061/g.15752 Transcript_13061/m.15752 type:complete len:357 (+) Transcript_13061:199-1269(+)